MTDLLAILKKPVTSFIYSKFSQAEPDEFSSKIQEYLQGNHNLARAKHEHPDIFDSRTKFIEHMDIHASLQLIEKGWSEIPESYPDSMCEDSLFLLENRNLWAHQKPFSRQDVEEVSKIAIRLLNKMKTTSARTAVKKIRQLLRHDYYRHISAAEHYISRRDILEPMEDELLKYDHVPLALHGMGGIGKSVLLRAICDGQSIQDRFVDGILWMTFGHEVGPVQLEQKLREWIKALNGTPLDTDSNSDELKNELAELLKNKACLLILDDVWDKVQLEAFQVTGSNCRIIFSTRDAEIAREVGARLQSVDVMSNNMAVELLDKWSQGYLQDTPRQYKEWIIDSVGALPLAIKLAGAQLQTKTAEEWLKTFKTSRLKSKRPVENNSHNSIEDTFALSLKSLQENERRLYTALSIFMTWEIPEQAILHLWQELPQLDIEAGKDLLTDLASRALYDLKIDDETGTRTIILHPLLKSLLYNKLDKIERQDFHRTIVLAYQTSKAGSGWHTVPDDGYFYHYFPHHLKEAGEDDLLRQLLLDYDFIQAKLIATQDIDRLLSDYYTLRDPVLQLIQYAIQQSELVLNDFPEQLVECLYTQLMLLRNQPDIDAFLDICYQSDSPKLFPIQSPFKAHSGMIRYLSDGETWAWRGGEPPNESDIEAMKPLQEFLPQVLPQILKDEQEKVSAHLPDPRPLHYPDGFFYMSSSFNIGNIHYGQTTEINMIEVSGDCALSPDHITTQSDNGDFVNKAGIKVFDCKTGHLIDFVHTGEVNSTAVSGDFVICASDDGTIKGWNWQTKKEVRILTKTSTPVRSLVLWEDYIGIVSEQAIILWNWQANEEICKFVEDEDSYIDVFLSEEIITFVTTNNVVHVWNWRTGTALDRLEYKDDIIISTSLRGGLVFYLLEDQSLKIGDWRSKKIIADIQKFSGQILDVVAHNRLLTSLNNRLQLWNLSTGDLIASIYAGDLYVPHDDYYRDDRIINAIVTPNYDRVIIGTNDGRIRFLEPNPALQKLLQESD